jgi:TRAP-type C4-dicarboxylate transport system substrate-binding protein
MKAHGVEIIQVDNKPMADTVKKAVYPKYAKDLQAFIDRIQAVK